MENINETVYWVWLAQALGPANSEASILFENGCGAREIYENADITPDSYVSERFGRLRSSTVKALRNKNLEMAGNIVTSCVRNAINIMHYGSPEYPNRLLGLRNLPVVLYYRGNTSLLSTPVTVGVVGTRNTTDYGESVTFDIVKTLCLYSVVTISGAAVGVDSMTHNTSRFFGCPTIAVLGNGLDDPYPRVNQPLIELMCKENLVITEYPPCTEPSGRNFPVRNRIISGLSDAVVVTEGDMKSGALITARLAEEEGKPVYAVPGSVYAQGCRGTNDLIRRGARICLNGEEIIADFSETAELQRLESVASSDRFRRYESFAMRASKSAGRSVPGVPDATRFPPLVSMGPPAPSGKASPENTDAGALKSKDEIINSVWAYIDETMKRAGLQRSSPHNAPGNGAAVNGTRSHAPGGYGTRRIPIDPAGTMPVRNERPGGADAAVKNERSAGNGTAVREDCPDGNASPAGNERHVGGDSPADGGHQGGAASGKSPSENPAETQPKPSERAFTTANDHVLDAMGNGETVNADTISERCGMPISKVMSILTMLELTSDVESLPGGLYRKR